MGSSGKAVGSAIDFFFLFCPYAASGMRCPPVRDGLRRLIAAFIKVLVDHEDGTLLVTLAVALALALGTTFCVGTMPDDEAAVELALALRVCTMDNGTPSQNANRE